VGAIVDQVTAIHKASVDRLQQIKRRIELDTLEAEYRVVFDAITNWLDKTERAVGDSGALVNAELLVAPDEKHVKQQANVIFPLLESIYSLDGAIALLGDYANRYLGQLESLDHNFKERKRSAYEQASSYVKSRAESVKKNLFNCRRVLNSLQLILDYLNWEREIESNLALITQDLAELSKQKSPSMSMVQRLEQKFKELNESQKQIVKRNSDLTLNEFVRRNRLNTIPPAYAAFVSSTVSDERSVDRNNWAIPLLPFLDRIISVERQFRELTGKDRLDSLAASSPDTNSITADSALQKEGVQRIVEDLNESSRQIIAVLNAKREACKKVTENLPEAVYSKRLTEMDLSQVLPQNTSLSALVSDLRSEYGEHRETLSEMEARDIPVFRQLTSQFLETGQVVEFSKERTQALKQLNQVELNFTEYRVTVHRLHHALNMTKTRNNLLMEI
jgi:hypothetical protein